jgi:chemotaxis protein MotA
MPAKIRHLMTKKLVVALAILGVVMLISLVSDAANYPPFLSLEGLIIVVGGSVANALLSYERNDVLKAFETIKSMLKKQKSRRHELHKDIMRLIMWSYVVQAHDFRGLEKEAAKTAHDPMERYGLDLVVSGYPSAKIREMMDTVTEAEFERRCAPVTVLRNMAATAPAFGMVGTLVGMVTILHNSAADLTNIESGLAVAMLSTLYGILVARLICLPAADKLLRQEEDDHFRNYMITEGLTLLAEKQRPFYMQDRLNSFLEPAQHLQLDRYMQVAFSNRIALAA